jgi:hypothetical protein
MHEEMPTYLVVKEMQTSRTVVFYLTPVRMPIIEKTNKKCWQEWKEKRNLFTPLAGK